MGLLDSVLGSVLGGQQASGDGQGNALGGLLGTLLSKPQLLQAIAGLLSNDGPQGGVGGLMEKFRQAGLGDVIDSWVGSGQNQAISSDRLSAVLGPDTLADLSGKMGASSGDTASQLAQLLPGLVDRLTPAGQLPEGGLGNSSDLMETLGSLLAGR